MRRPIGWVDKDDEGGRREVRVSFHADKVKWQFLPAGSDKWDYDTPPTEALWQELEVKLQQLIQRGHLFQGELELVKRRGKALKK